MVELFAEATRNVKVGDPADEATEVGPLVSTKQRDRVTDYIQIGLHGIELSRASGLWAALKMATAVADGSATVTVEPFTFVAPDRTIDGRPFTHTVTGRLLQPTLGPLERDLHRARLELARRYAAANPINEIVVHSAGDTIGFTVTVTNTGAGTAKGVTVSDTLPTDAGLNWTLDDDAGGASRR